MSDTKKSGFKEFSGAFLLMFALFACVGGVAGWKMRFETAQTEIYKNLEVVESNGEYQLLLDCSPHYSFAWAVDSDKGKTDTGLSRTAEMKATVLGKPSKRHMEYVGILGGFFAGTTGGKTIYDLVRKPKSMAPVSRLEFLKKSIVGVIGAVTGYSFGRYLTRNYNVECDSALGMEVLGDTALWMDFEKKRLIFEIRDMESLPGATIDSVSGQSIYPWQDNPIFECSPQLKMTEKRLNEQLKVIDINPTSQLFSEVNYLKKITEKIAASHAFSELQRLSIYHNNIIDIAETAPQVAETIGYSPEVWDQYCDELSSIADASIQ